jgi:hypothetical protein
MGDVLKNVLKGAGILLAIGGLCLGVTGLITCWYIPVTILILYGIGKLASRF